MKAEEPGSEDITLEALGDALGLHDAATLHHARRVTAFTLALARVMRVPDLVSLSRGAFLHDIGKIAIAPDILRKSGALTPEETRIVRDHCAKGYELVRKVAFLAEAAEIVYAHHENWDGTGYPRNLKGSDIPLGARIVAVANALDAMISDQPYRSARSFSEAREEIAGWSGRQFDPDVVKCFFVLPATIWQDLDRGISAQLAAQTR